MGRLSKGLLLSNPVGAGKFIKRLNEQFKNLTAYETEHKSIMGNILYSLRKEFRGGLEIGEKVNEKTGARYLVIANTKANQKKASRIEKALVKGGYKTAAERRKEIREQAKKIKKETKTGRKVVDIARELKERKKLFDYIKQESDFAYNEQGEMFADISELTGGEDFSRLSTSELRKLKKQIQVHKKELENVTDKEIERQTGRSIIDILGEKFNG